jgi:N-acylglucosamine 2-epimerase
MKYAKIYKDALLDDIIPFWEQHSIDSQHSGFFTCLNRKGDVFDTDKFTWLQGRQAWMFSVLYNEVEPKEAWLDIAKSGINFLVDHAMDKDGNFYFSTTREGEPLVQPYNIFSDCFAAMAFAQYAKATGEDTYSELARATYHNILKKQHNPKGKYEKSTGNRALKGFSLPMILSNLVLELEHILDHDEIEKTLDQCISEVTKDFLDRSTGLIRENVQLDGSPSDTFEGRLINPGHGIEAMWFLMDIGVRRNDKSIMKLAANTIITTLEYSWDKQYGGIFYFMDSEGRPPLQLEWDQKLWWVHLETLVALTKAMEHIEDERLQHWYTKVHHYSWDHFPDPKYGEWYGYLNRQGEPLLELKGGKWKGCFHVPRAMYQCWKTFERIENKQ